MSRRKGELTAGVIDRGWPHQVAILADKCLGKRGEAVRRFCEKLTHCPRGAERFMAEFGGEWFDPRDRGRSADWNKWYKGRAGSRA